MPGREADCHARSTMKLSSIAIFSVASSTLATAYVLRWGALINPIKDAIISGVINGRHQDIPEAQASSEINEFVPLIMNDDLLPLFDNAVDILLSPTFEQKFPDWISSVIAALEKYEQSPDFTSATSLLSEYLPHYDYHEAVNQASITLAKSADGWNILKAAVLSISTNPAASKAIDDGLFAVTGLICTLQLTDGSVCDPYKTEDPVVPASTSEPAVSTSSSEPAVSTPSSELVVSTPTIESEVPVSTSEPVVPASTSESNAPVVSSKDVTPVESPTPITTTKSEDNVASGLAPKSPLLPLGRLSPLLLSSLKIPLHLDLPPKNLLLPSPPV